MKLTTLAIAATLIATTAAHAHILPDGAAHTHPWERYLFVPNRDSNDIAVIDTATDTLLTRIPTGATPHQVALSAPLGVLAVSNSGDDTLSLIDLATMETRALALGGVPEHMELHPDGDLLAVGNIDEGSVSLVSLSEGRETRRIAGLHEPHNLTFSPDGETLYVSNLGANFVSAIEVASGRIADPLVIGEGRASASLPGGHGHNHEHQGIINITPSADGATGFAAFGDGDVMGVFDLRSGDRLAAVPTGDRPWRAFPSAHGEHMLVPNNGERTVSVFATEAPFREIARLPGGADMTGINAGHATAFVIARGSEEIHLIDMGNMESAGVISLPGAAPETGIITPDGEKLYVALSGANAIAVIDVESRSLLRRIENVGEAPWGAFMHGADNYCH